MSKVIFRETNYPEFDFLYDNDGITNESGKNNALYVIVPDRWNDYPVTNKNEFETIRKNAEEIATDFDDLKNGCNNYFRNYKENL